MNQGKSQREAHYESIANALVEFSRRELDQMAKFYQKRWARKSPHNKPLPASKFSVCVLVKLDWACSMPRKSARRRAASHLRYRRTERCAGADQELESKAIKTDGMRMHGQGPGYSVYVIDPSGNRIELSKD